MKSEGPGWRWLQALIQGLVRRPALSLLLLAVVTAGAGTWGSGIPIRQNLEDLFPEDTPAVVRAREARATLGSRKELRVLLGGSDREVNRRAAKELAERLSSHSGLVDDVSYRRDVSFFEAQGLLYMPVEDLRTFQEEVREAIRAAVRKDMALDDDFGLADDEEDAAEDGTEQRDLPTMDEVRERYRMEGLSEYYESPDGQVLAVKVRPAFDPTEASLTHELMGLVEADIQAVLETAPGVRTTVVGDYSQLTRAVNQIRADLAKSTVVALLAVVLILGFAFRRARAVLLVVLPLVVGLAWTLAMARLTVGYLNVITAFIFAILVGLGIDFAVHAMSRVDEEIRRGLPLEEAIPSALMSLGRAMTAAVATTMATFSALIVFDFRGFSQFGGIAAMGVALCLAAVYLVLPPLAMLMDRGRRASPETVAGVVQPEVGSGLPRRWALAAIIAMTALVAASVPGIPRVDFEGDMRKLRTKVAAQADELRTKYRKEADTRKASPALMLTGGLEETRAVHRHLEARADDIPELNQVASIYSFVPEEQETKLKIVRDIKRRIDMKYGILEGKTREDADKLMPHLEPKEFGAQELPGWLKERFTDTGGQLGRYVLLYPNGVKSDAREVLKIRDAIGTLELEGKTYHATATWMITGEAYEAVRREGPLAVGLAALVVFILLLVDTRRITPALSRFLPLAVGFCVHLGLLGWLGIPLNLFNVIVLPTIFGLGVDTAIHLGHRIEEERSVLVGLKTAGRASGVAALTTAVGFASLLLVSNEGLRSIGAVATLGIIVVYVATTVLVSAFAALGKPRG